MTYIRRDEYGDPVMTLSDLALDAQADADRTRAKNLPAHIEMYGCAACRGKFYDEETRDRHQGSCDGGWEAR